MNMSVDVFGYALADYLGAGAFTTRDARCMVAMLSNALTGLYGHIVLKTKDRSARCIVMRKESNCD